GMFVSMDRSTSSALHPMTCAIKSCASAKCTVTRSSGSIHSAIFFTFSSAVIAPSFRLLLAVDPPATHAFLQLAAITPGKQVHFHAPCTFGISLDLEFARLVPPTPYAQSRGETLSLTSCRTFV